MRKGLVVALLSASVLGGIAYSLAPMLIRSTPPDRRFALAHATPGTERIVCTGIVEAIAGEVDVCAQIAGELADVRIREGEVVKQGQVLAVVDAARIKADVDIANAVLGRAKAALRHIQAGTGNEEKQEALLDLESTTVLLSYELSRRDRIEKLYEENATSLDSLDEVRKQVEHLRKKAGSFKKHYEALCRGPLPEEVDLFRAKVAEAEAHARMAEVNYEYRTVRAPCGGVVATLYLHQGDTVSIDQITPILRLINTSGLRIRLEIDEADVLRLKELERGQFSVRGISGDAGPLLIKTVLPQFGPKRLFTPDTSARLDTRTLSVLCEISESSIPLYPGQRVTAFIAPNTTDTASKLLTYDENSVQGLPP